MTDTAPPIIPTPSAEDEADAGRRRAIIGLLIGFVAILIIVVAVQWITDTESDSVDAGGGTPFPAVQLTTVTGEPFSTADFGGQPTVVNFFASWCAPCRAEMPDFEEAFQEVKGDVAFVGINISEPNEEDALALIEETGITYEVLLGAADGLLEDVRGLAMPTTVFVSADGMMLETHSGILNREALLETIDEVFG